MLIKPKSWWKLNFIPLLSAVLLVIRKSRLQQNLRKSLQCLKPSQSPSLSSPTMLTPVCPELIKCTVIPPMAQLWFLHFKRMGAGFWGGGVWFVRGIRQTVIGPEEATSGAGSHPLPAAAAACNPRSHSQQTWSLPDNGRHASLYVPLCYLRWFIILQKGFWSYRVCRRSAVVWENSQWPYIRTKRKATLHNHLHHTAAAPKCGKHWWCWWDGSINVNIYHQNWHVKKV